jgi:hypothetical protein
MAPFDHCSLQLGFALRPVLVSMLEQTIQILVKILKIPSLLFTLASMLEQVPLLRNQ